MDTVTRDRHPRRGLGAGHHLFRPPFSLVTLSSMTNTLPVPANCTPPATRDTACAAAAKAAWTAQNVIADADYDAAKLIIDDALTARLLVYTNFSQPAGWSKARWVRRRARMREGAFGIYDIALKSVTSIRDGDYMDINEDYEKAMADCCVV